MTIAAVAFKRSKIPYEDLLLTVFVKFVNLLGPRPRGQRRGFLF